MFVDDVVAEFASFDFDGAFHEAFEVVGDLFLQNCFLHALLDQGRRLRPSLRGGIA